VNAGFEFLCMLDLLVAYEVTAVIAPEFGPDNTCGANHTSITDARGARFGEVFVKIWRVRNHHQTNANKTASVNEACNHAKFCQSGAMAGAQSRCRLAIRFLRVGEVSQFRLFKTLSTGILTATDVTRTLPSIRSATSLCDQACLVSNLSLTFPF